MSQFHKGISNRRREPFLPRMRLLRRLGVEEKAVLLRDLTSGALLQTTDRAPYYEVRDGFAENRRICFGKDFLDLEPPPILTFQRLPFQDRHFLVEKVRW